MSTATKTVPDIVLDVLNRSTTDGNRLDLPGTLDPKTEYPAVKKVINALGGAWNRKADTHLWPAGTDVAAVIEPVLLTGKVTDQRKQFDAFYTPPEIATQVVDAAGVRAGHVVLEPSAGGGALAIEAADRGATVFTWELRETPFFPPEHLVNHIAQGLGVDFLTVEPDPRPRYQHDRVVMNPPFSNQKDMAHVRHAARFVRPGGRLAAVMSPAFMFRTTPIARDFRDWLDGHTHDAEALPDGAFKVSGTGVRTVLLTVDL